MDPSCCPSTVLPVSKGPAIWSAGGAVVAVLRGAARQVAPAEDSAMAFRPEPVALTESWSCHSLANAGCKVVIQASSCR